MKKNRCFVKSIVLKAWWLCETTVQDPADQSSGMLVPGGRLAQARVFLPVLQHPKISCGCIQAIHFVREPASSVSGVVSMTEHGTLVGLGAETLLLRLELSVLLLLT